MCFKVYVLLYVVTAVCQLLINGYVMLFTRPTVDLAERNSTKTGYIFGSECDLKMYVQNCRYFLSVKIGVHQNHIFLTLFDDFATAIGATLTAKQNIGQWGKCVGNYEGSHRPTSSQKIMNFGPQTAQNRSHPP